MVWHTDYILSQVARLRGTPKSAAVLLVDPTQVEGVKSIYGPDRFDHIDFFPHPAVGERAVDDATLAEFIERRPMTLAGHTWDHQVEQILAAAEAVRS